MNPSHILSLLAQPMGVSPEELSNADRDENLFDLGLTSIGFIQFIVKLEQEFNIEVLDSDLVTSNFTTINRVLDTLSKYFDTHQSLKKVIVCDCDNVLWNGVAGEENIVINSYAHDLQEMLCTLVASGVLLCLCSKNEPSAIRAAFEHPDMLLTQEHIVASKINRTDKASNILALAQELNLSTDSFVFLDDSDYEIELINNFLPDVCTVKIDHTPDTFDTINSLFATVPASTVNHTQQYREQKNREQDKQRFTTVEEYNASLNTEASFHDAVKSEAARIAELSQRTNQCNLTGARYTTEGIERMLNNEHYQLITLTVSDKYGDMGLVGCAIVRTNPAPLIESFFVSCRAFDRGLEVLLLNAIKDRYPNTSLQGQYRETAKNTRYRDFYLNNGVVSI